MNLWTTRPSALGMSDPVMEFLEFPEKEKIFWGRGERFLGRREMISVGEEEDFGGGGG